MTFKGELRPYQVEPVEFMKERGKVLLAAEQGTGKTPMTIKAIEDMFDDERITVPGIVVCLSTLKYQWADSIEKFTEGTSIPLVIDGTPKQRAAQYERAIAQEADYVIVNYEQVVNEWDLVRRLGQGFVVVDEASFIKGFRSQRAKHVKRLGKGVPYKFGLSGTPIENGKPEELFSIMEFVDPEVFGRADIFDRTFVVRNDNGWVSRYRNIPTFQKTLQTAMVRLRASDPGVREYMPETDDKSPMLVRLDRAGQKVYDAIAKDLLKELEAASAWGGNFSIDANYGGASAKDSAEDRARGRIGQRLMALQMLCDHPALLARSAAKHDQGGQGGSAYCAMLRDSGLLAGLSKSPKMIHTLRWVKDVLDSDERNKIVLFTRYVGMAQILAEALGEQAMIYTGELNAKQKDHNLKRFQRDPEVRVLVATDAGGFGLDIPQANYLLNYDLPDGAGAADQRDTRIVRASSTFTTVSRNWIFIKGSVEERKHMVLQQKRAVARAFVDARGLNHRGGVDLDAKSLTAFLKSTRT